MTDDYEQKSDQIRKLASMEPEQLADHLSVLHKDLAGAAPNILPHVYSTAIKSIRFLNNSLPGSSGGMLQDSASKPTKSEKAQWLSLHNIVNDPVSIIDHIKKDSLNPKHVEAIKSVYPELHGEMVDKMNQHLGLMKSNGEQLPYHKRVTMSLFMGKPLDSTQTQPLMASIIAANAPKVAQQPGKTPKATSSTMAKVNKMYATPDQARATDRTGH